MRETGSGTLLEEGLSLASPPTLIQEMHLKAQGYSLIAGVDEAGRGPLAGPVVAGAVILPIEQNPGWLHLPRDSKLLSEQQRGYIFAVVEEKAVATGVGVVSVEDIDRIGIGKASLLAMQRAVESLAVRPQFVLVDAFKIPNLALPQKGIIQGDSLCLSIAAASIVAKVTRDKLMVELDAQHPDYGFAQHKGYPTPYHLACLSRFGPCPIHRRSFAPVREILEAKSIQEGDENG